VRSSQGFITTKIVAALTFRAGVPQLFAEVDRTKAKTLDIPLNDVFSTLQAYLGSAYVNDFNKFGRTWQVKVQADSEFRLKPEDIRQLEVRNRKGEMIPLGILLIGHPRPLESHRSRKLTLCHLLH
jgi:HAE1 family hydrophobic/amphiphilic exporter-1